MTLASSGAPPCRPPADTAGLLKTVSDVLNPAPAANELWARDRLVSDRAAHVASVLAMADEVSTEALTAGVRQAAAYFPVTYREAAL
ncbi:MAG TPA: hypothetical protein VKZ89_16030 [Thermobifida alba]|nr:hypothetical protein [Thermobifida alba]